MFREYPIDSTSFIHNQFIEHPNPTNVQHSADDYDTMTVFACPKCGECILPHHGLKVRKHPIE